MDNVKRECEVILLPIEGKSKIFTSRRDDKLHYHFKGNTPNNVKSYQHLYIISDDEIKEGDWVYHAFSNTVFKFDLKDEIIKVSYKKVIATTDISLTIKYDKRFKDVIINNKSLNQSLPQPSQQFIEKYVEEYNKGQQIIKIKVEYENIEGTCSCYYTKFCKAPQHLETLELCKDEINIKLKISKDNTITISKIKDTWNREEVIIKLKQFKEDTQCFSNSEFMKKYKSILSSSEITEQWIKENL